MFATDRFTAYAKFPLPEFITGWAGQVGISLAPANETSAYELEYKYNRLRLNWRGVDRFLPVSVEAPKPGRASTANLLVRAIGRHTARVADVTAGFGTDAFTLALCGASVCCVERNAAVALLLFDGLSRCPRRIADNVTLEFDDSTNWLAHTEVENDTIYIDTMFADKKKSARAPKHMQMLRQISGDDEDASLLFNAALVSGASRVVVKSADDGPVMNYPVNAQFKGKTVRFDVYLPERDK